MALSSVSSGGYPDSRSSSRTAFQSFFGLIWYSRTRNGDVDSGGVWVVGGAPCAAPPSWPREAREAAMASAMKTIGRMFPIGRASPGRGMERPPEPKCVSAFRQYITGWARFRGRRPASGAAGGGFRSPARGDRGDRGGQHLQLERLVDAGARRLIDEAPRLGVDGVARGEDHPAGQIGPARADAFVQLHAAHLRHLEIEQQDVVAAALDLLQRLAPAGSRVHVVPLPPQSVHDQVEEHRLVVHRENAEGPRGAA